MSPPTPRSRGTDTHATMTNPYKHLRKRKLVDKALQLRMVAIFVTIGCASVLFQVILMNASLLDLAREAPDGGLEMLESARGKVATNIIWTLGVMIPLMASIGIAATHRVAGPAYRMRRHLEGIAEGGPVTRCRIRKGDEFQGLCDALNAAIERLAPSVDPSEEHSDEGKLESTPAVAPAATSDETEDTESEQAA